MPNIKAVSPYTWLKQLTHPVRNMLRWEKFHKVFGQSFSKNRTWILLVQSRDTREQEFKRISSRGRSSSEAVRNSSTVSVMGSTRHKKKRSRIKLLRSKERSTSSSLKTRQPSDDKEIQCLQTLSKSHHDAICVAYMADAQKKNLNFYQMQSGCVVCFDTISKQYNTLRKSSTSGTADTNARIRCSVAHILS